MLRQATDLTIQPDGKIVVAGGGSDSSRPDYVVARYLPNGSLDASFATGAGNGGGVWSNIYYDGKLSAVALAPDGRIVALGQNYAYPTVIRLTATGQSGPNLDNLVIAPLA